MSTTNNTTQDLPQYKNYAEFVSALPGILKKQYDDNVAALNSYQASQEAALKEQQRLAEMSAHKGLQRAYVDTDTSYQQAVATYGANAQKLAGMGLAGSGYSDYLTASAYAANRANKAVADAQHGAAVSDANQAYYTGKNTLNDTIAQRMNELGNSYTANLLSAQENALKYQKETATQNAQTYAAIGDNAGAFKAQLDAGTDPATVKASASAYYKSSLENPASFDWDDFAKSKDILGDDYNTILEEFRDNFNPNLAFDVGDEELDFASAKKAYEHYKNDVKVSGDALVQLEKIYNEKYVLHTQNDVRTNASLSELNSTGNNFTVYVNGDNVKRAK